jgi:predicted NAD/FAD-dependent oxidoreductase
MVAFSERWQVPFDGAFINHGPVRWIARDTSKPSRPNDLDCWVLHSNHDWAESYLQLSKDDVSDLLLEELGKMVSVALPEPLYRQSHRWLYASVDQACSQEDCEWDSKTKLGVCGDWFRTSNIEGALLSGMALAGRVLGTLHADQLETNLSTQESMRARQLELF